MAAMHSCLYKEYNCQDIAHSVAVQDWNLPLQGGQPSTILGHAFSSVYEQKMLRKILISFFWEKEIVLIRWNMNTSFDPWYGHYVSVHSDFFKTANKYFLSAVFFFLEWQIELSELKTLSSRLHSITLIWNLDCHNRTIDSMPWRSACIRNCTAMHCG